MIEQAKHLANTLDTPVESENVQRVIAAINRVYAAGGRTALGSCQQQLGIAIAHLQAVLRKDDNADTAALDWLISIGA